MLLVGPPTTVVYISPQKFWARNHCHLMPTEEFAGYSISRSVNSRCQISLTSQCELFHVTQSLFEQDNLFNLQTLAIPMANYSDHETQ